MSGTVIADSIYGINQLFIFSGFVGEKMPKQVITTHGEEQLVREDTAKSFRGVYWALFSLAAFIIIAAILFFGGFLTAIMRG
jgi:hypothetical protein